MPRRNRSTTQTPPLVNWEDDSRQRQVLDWRHRVNAFIPAAAQDAETGDLADTEPSRLIAAEEPEASASRTLDDEDPDGSLADRLTTESPEESEAPLGAAPGISDDVDL